MTLPASWRGFTAAAISIAALLVSTARAVAQDECSSATPVVNGANGPFTNVGATTSRPWTCAPGGNDVWFAYVATCTGLASVDVCGAQFDTVLEVFDGSNGCGNLVSLGCNDDACGLQSSVTFQAGIGATYFFRVGGYANSTGSFPLHVQCTNSAAPNDECQGATTVVDGANGPFGNVGATTSAPAWPGINGSHDVWFAYVATSCGNLTVDTCGASFDTCLEVLGGTCGTLGSLGANDDACGAASSLTVPVAIGRRYYVRVGGSQGGAGTFPLHISCVTAPPANDECTGAMPIHLGHNGPFTNECATTSAQPWPCASGGNDLWFAYTPTITAPHTFRLCGSDFDTAMELLDGAGGCGNLVSLGCNDDVCGVQSSLTANLVTGVVCYVRVGGYIGSTGTIQLEALLGTGAGSIAYSSPGCGPATLAITGDPGIGGRLTLQIGNATGAPFVGLGFGPFPGSAYCGCTFGHGWQSLDFGSTRSILIPANPAFIGQRFGVQGADLFGVGGCPTPAFTLTETRVITIG